jgi:hypothetical protein
MIDLESIRYVPCRDQWPRRTNAAHIWIVLHSIESGEGGETAEACANYFRDPRNPNGTPRIASTQFVVDNNSTIRCAEWENRVAGAVGANDEGWHIEQAGVAAQSADQWRDDYSTDMVMRQTAPLVAALAHRDGIPLRFVDAAGLKRGQPGVTTHHECWKAFGGDVRTDPGANYPMTEMLVEAIRLYGGEPTGDEFDMADLADLDFIVARHALAQDARTKAYIDKLDYEHKLFEIDVRDQLGIFIDERTDQIMAELARQGALTAENVAALKAALPPLPVLEVSEVPPPTVPSMPEALARVDADLAALAPPAAAA